MRCARIERMLTPLLDGRLTPAQQAEVEQHLEGCTGCRQTHALLKAAAATLATQGPAQPPEDLAARAARAAFAASPAGATDWIGELVQSLRWPALGTAAAAMLLAVGLFTSVPERIQDTGVAPESFAAVVAGDDEVVSDTELLSEVLGQEVQ